VVTEAERQAASNRLNFELWRAARAAGFARGVPVRATDERTGITIITDASAHAPQRSRLR
jgi:hypothetical protein